MPIGTRRMKAAKTIAALAFLCGVIGLMAGFTNHFWKLGPTGWFAGGALLSLIALFVLVDGALAYQKSRS
jgi:uncharacterized membrane protein YiaA